LITANDLSMRAEASYIRQTESISLIFTPI